VSSVVDGDACAEASDEFAKGIDSFGGEELQTLAHVIDANRLTYSAYEMLGGLDSMACRTLRDCLKPTVLRLEELRGHRDSLLRKLVFLLEDDGIGYVVYKTLNRSGWVGVDIDILVESSRFDDCIRILHAEGFSAVDELSKRYAVGFMVKGNPTVVDLHSQLTVLGVPYLSPEVLLGGRRKVRYESSPGEEALVLCVPEAMAELVVRLAHAVIKEGSVSAGEVVEVCPALRDLDCLVPLVEGEHLELALGVFSFFASAVPGFEGFRELRVWEGSFFSALAARLLSRGDEVLVPPFRVSLPLRALALVDHLYRGDELGRMPLQLGNLRFRRSAAYLGHKLVEDMCLS